MSTGFQFPWEREAMRGEGLPDGLDLSDQMAYTSLRHTYFLYQQKAISRDQAAAEKQKIRSTWQTAKGHLELCRRINEHYAKVYRCTEQTKTACRKKPTAENAIALCNAIDGIGLEEGKAP